MRVRVDVSPEMVAFVGHGPVPVADGPAGPVIGFTYRFAPGVFACQPPP